LPESPFEFPKIRSSKMEKYFPLKPTIVKKSKAREANNPEKSKLY